MNFNQKEEPAFKGIVFSDLFLEVDVHTHQKFKYPEIKREIESVHIPSSHKSYIQCWLIVPEGSCDVKLNPKLVNWIN